MPAHSYFQHDNRGQSRQVIMDRRKNFQGFKHSGFKGPRGRYDEDGDISMALSDRSRNSRFKPYKGRSHFGKNKPNQYGGGFRRDPSGNSFNNDDTDTTQWFKITIPYGKKMGKTFIMKAISSHCRMPFTPYNFHFHGAAAVFYVDNSEISFALSKASRRATTPDGYKMAIYTIRVLLPAISVDTMTIEKIKTSMGKRYNTARDHLDMSSFSSDPDLMREGVYISLNKSDVMNAVVQIIKENVPQLQQLDLSENKLITLDGLTPLVGACKRLKSLILKHNKLKVISVLNAIKGMDLLELDLYGNVLRDNFKDHSTYISTIREKFPKIIKLDREELPAPILFSLGTEEVMPPSKGSSFPGEEVKILVAQFLEQYYTIFDSNNRQPLLDAYHDQAVFSFSASKMYKGRSLQEYIHDSRNLLQIDNNLKHKLLRQGRVNVVSSLSQMPQTQHDPTSFVVDVSLATPTLMNFTVTGVFMEVTKNKHQSAPIRTFSRTFMVVPQGQGFSIINDIMFLTNATDGQVKAFRMVTPTPTPSPAPSNNKTTDEQQKQMVVEFSNWTRMNFEFSAKCLEENEWDYEKAANVFQTLNARGSIPIEAFQKDSSQR